MLSTQKPKPATPAPEPEPVVDEVVSSPVIEPTPTTVHETVLSLDLTEYDREGPTVHEHVPDPPKCIKQKLEQYEKVWRWLSKPHVDKRGMRQYTAYSPNKEDKIAMQKGDCPPGVHVSVDNRLCWGEDAFLGFTSRRFYEQRQADLERLNRRLVKESQRSDVLDEIAKRGGFKAPNVKVEPDDKPRYGL